MAPCQQFWYHRLWRSQVLNWTTQGVVMVSLKCCNGLSQIPNFSNQPNDIWRFELSVPICSNVTLCSKERKSSNCTPALKNSEISFEKSRARKTMVPGPHHGQPKDGKEHKGGELGSPEPAMFEVFYPHEFLWRPQYSHTHTHTHTDLKNHRKSFHGSREISFKNTFQPMDLSTSHPSALNTCWSASPVCGLWIHTWALISLFHRIALSAKYHCLWLPPNEWWTPIVFPLTPDSNMFKSHVSEAWNHTTVIKHGCRKSSHSIMVVKTLALIHSWMLLDVSSPNDIEGS